MKRHTAVTAKNTAEIVIQRYFLFSGKKFLPVISKRRIKPYHHQTAEKEPSRIMERRGASGGKE